MNSQIGEDLYVMDSGKILFMKKVIYFISINRVVLAAMLIGLFLGYIYWYYWGCYWGTYPLSSECWVNCSVGSLLSGFITSILEEM